MSLKERFSQLSLREKAGSISSSRFDFQKDWSLCKLLSLHLSGQDYLLIFEYGEDLVELDSDKDPQKISFYQVKTTSKNNWTLPQLLKRELGGNGLKLSFLGKMYSNKIDYPLDTKSLNFVSNAPYKVRLKGNEKETKHEDICINQCSDEEISKISKQLTQEHTLSVPPIFAEITFLKNAGLHLQDSSTHTLGVLTAFLEKVFPKKNYKPDLIYKTLIAEIRRKTNLVIEKPSFEMLRENKGIGKTSFEEILNSIGFNSDFDSRFRLISQKLNNENEDPREIEKLQKAWTELEINLMDKTNIIHSELCLVVEKIANIEIGVGRFTGTFLAYLEKVVTSYKKTGFCNENKIYTEAYIKAIALWCFYEKQL